MWGSPILSETNSGRPQGGEQLTRAPSRTGELFACGEILGAKAVGGYGYGSKESHQETAGFSPSFHLPGFHLGYIFLTHSHINPYPNDVQAVPSSNSYPGEQGARWAVHVSGKGGTGRAPSSNHEKNNNIFCCCGVPWAAPRGLNETRVCLPVDNHRGRLSCVFQLIAIPPV